MKLDLRLTVKHERVFHGEPYFLRPWMWKSRDTVTLPCSWNQWSGLKLNGVMSSAGGSKPVIAGQCVSPVRRTCGPRFYFSQHVTAWAWRQRRSKTTRVIVMIDYYHYCSLFRSNLEAKAKLTSLLIIAFMCFRKINGRFCSFMLIQHVSLHVAYYTREPWYTH